MTRYDAYLLAHIVGALVWVGAGVLFVLQAALAERARDAARLQALLADMEALGNRVFAPSALVVLGFGLLMVADGPWSFGELWIALALAGFAATSANGILFFQPATGRLMRAIERDGGLSPDALAAVRRMLAVARADLVLLLAIVTLMVVKPTGADVAVLGALATALVAAAGYAYLRGSTPIADVVPEIRTGGG